MAITFSVYKNVRFLTVEKLEAQISKINHTIGKP